MKSKTMPRVMALLLTFGMVGTSVISMPVDAEAAAKVKLSAVKQTMYVGGSFDLKVKSPKGKKATYKTSNKKVAMVNKKGKVTAKSVGTATITVKVAGIKKAAQCKVTVKEGVKSIQTASQLFIQKGKKAKLNYGVTPSNVEKKAKKMTFKTNKKKIATVDKNGNVKGKKPGKAKITIQTAGGGAKATVNVKVVKKLTPVKNITLSKAALALNTGASETLTATVEPAKATAKNVYWVSSNTEVATVSKSGQVTAVADGTATITAYAADTSKKKATCTVTVTTPAPVPTPTPSEDKAVESVTVTPATLTLKANEAPAQLTATVLPTDATNRTVTWSVDNSLIASVDPATGVVTPVSAGEATVTATAGGKTATCKVTVIGELPASDINEFKYTYTLDKAAESYKAVRASGKANSVKKSDVENDYAWLAEQIDDEYWDNNFFKTNWSKFDSKFLKKVSNIFAGVVDGAVKVTPDNDNNTITIDAGKRGIITVIREDAADNEPCTLTIKKGEKETVLKEVTVAKDSETNTVTITAKTKLGAAEAVLKVTITKDGVTVTKDDNTIVTSKVTDSAYVTEVNATYYKELMGQLGFSFDLEKVEVYNVYTK